MFGKVLKFMFTGKDNESFELMRGLTALSVIMMLFYIGWHLIVNKIFDPLAAAGGLGALLFGSGLGTAAKDGTFTASQNKVSVTAGGQKVEVNAGEAG